MTHEHTPRQVIRVRGRLEWIHKARRHTAAAPEVYVASVSTTRPAASQARKPPESETTFV